MRNFSEVEILIDVVIGEREGEWQRARVIAGINPQGQALGVRLMPHNKFFAPGSICRVRPIGFLAASSEILAVIPGAEPWGRIYDGAGVDFGALQITPLGIREAWSRLSEAYFASRLSALSGLTEVRVCERKLTKENKVSKRRLVAANKDHIVTERLLTLDRTYYIDGRPVWANGQTIRRWDFPGKWFNLCQVIGTDGKLVGYYQDVQLPVILTGEGVDTVDLVLDLWVWPDGGSKVLDMDELLALKELNYLPESYLNLSGEVIAEIKDLWRKEWFSTHLALI